jgi:altronate dehydratase
VAVAAIVAVWFTSMLAGGAVVIVMVPEGGGGVFGLPLQPVISIGIAMATAARSVL